jgi:hypothetical protein
MALLSERGQCRHEIVLVTLERLIAGVMNRDGDQIRTVFLTNFRLIELAWGNVIIADRISKRATAEVTGLVF